MFSLSVNSYPSLLFRPIGQASTSFCTPLSNHPVTSLPIYCASCPTPSHPTVFQTCSREEILAGSVMSTLFAAFGRTRECELSLHPLRGTECVHDRENGRSHRARTEEQIFTCSESCRSECHNFSKENKGKGEVHFVSEQHLMAILLIGGHSQKARSDHQIMLKV